MARPAESGLLLDPRLPEVNGVLIQGSGSTSYSNHITGNRDFWVQALLELRGC